MTAGRLQFLRPSGAALWTACAAYLRACAEYAAPPETADDIKVREEGTACHWLAENLVETGAFPAETIAPNNVAIDADMRSAAQLYVAEITHTMYTAGAPSYRAVERSVDCSIIYPGMSGSPDFAACAGNTLYVFDLKYGFGYVEVFRNLQLSIYALALGNKLGLSDATNVELCIVQPRAITDEGPTRKWKTTLGWLRTNMLGMLQMKAVQAMHDHEATAGLHCLDCPGRHECSRFINMASSVCRQSGRSVPIHLTPSALGAELRVVKDMMKILEGRKESLESQVAYTIKNGGTIPGWRFKPSRGREAYLPGTEQAFMGIAKMHGVDASRPITPAEARKVLPRYVMDAFTTRPKAGMALSYVGPYEIEKELSK